MAAAAEALPPDLLLAWTLAVAEGRHLAAIGVVNKVLADFNVSLLDDAIEAVLANGNCNEREAKYIIAFSDALLRLLENQEREHEGS